jgi:hypothetical protein
MTVFGNLVRGRGTFAAAILLRLPEEMLNRLKREADAEQVTLQSVVRERLARSLERDAIQPATEARVA